MRINRHHHSPASALPERDLDRMIERLAGAVDPVEFREAELAERVYELLDVARRVFGAAGAGLMLVDEREQLGLVGASSEAARALERAQQQTGVGPGVQSTQTQQVVVVEDLAADPRWPQLSESLAGREVRGVLSAPISLHGRAIGNLNLFDSKPRAWTAADLGRARSLAEVAPTWLRVAVAAHDRGRRVLQLLRTLGSDGPAAPAVDES
jgi:GAF domain-containing protein